MSLCYCTAYCAELGCDCGCHARRASVGANYMGRRVLRSLGADAPGEVMSMRTFTGPQGTTINYNSDGSGMALFHMGEVPPGVCQLAIPCEDLVAFVAELVRQARISALEQAAPWDLLR